MNLFNVYKEWSRAHPLKPKTQMKKHMKIYELKKTAENI